LEHGKWNERIRQKGKTVTNPTQPMTNMTFFGRGKDEDKEGRISRKHKDITWMKRKSGYRTMEEPTFLFMNVAEQTSKEERRHSWGGNGKL